MKINNYFIVLIFSLLLISSCKKKENPQTDSKVNYSGALINSNASFDIFEMPAGGPISIPSSFDLTNEMPPVRNQGSQGSCVGFALAYLKSFQEKTEKGYSYSDNTRIMSPSFIYNQVKEKGDCQAGTVVSNALNFLVSNGCATENEFPYLESNCTIIPNTSIQGKAKQNKIKNWKGFNFTNNPDILDELKYAISQKNPIVIAYKVDIEFTNPQVFSWGNYIWKENNSGDPYVNGVRTEGYHCSLLVGYDDSKNAFKILNSWGTLWKNDGYCWVDYQWFLKRKNAAMVAYDEVDNGGSNGSKISVSGPTIPSNVPIGSTQNFIVNISNVGQKAFSISNLVIENNLDLAYDFQSGKPSLPISVSPGTSINLNLSFSPKSEKLYSSTFRVISDAENGSNFIELNNFGGSNNQNSSVIRLSKTACSNTIINTKSIFVLSIFNDGNQPFTVSSIASSSSAFTVENFTPQSVLPSSFVTYNIGFMPTSVQEYNSIISVGSSASSGENSISVSAFGLTNGGGGGVTSSPTIGNFTNCNYSTSTRSFASIDPFYSGPYLTNVYRVKVQSINLSTNRVTFSLKRCDGLNVQNNIWIRMVDLTNTGNWQKTFFQTPGVSEAIIETDLPGSLEFSGHDNRNYVFLVEEKFIDYCTDVVNLSW